MHRRGCEIMIRSRKPELWAGTTDDPGRTRACNLWFRRPTPYPLGHRATALLRYLKSLTLSRSLTRQWSSTRDSLQSSCVPLSRSGSTKVSSPSQAASFFHGQTLCSMSVTRTCEEACVPECYQLCGSPARFGRWRGEGSTLLRGGWLPLETCSSRNPPSCSAP